MAIYHLSAKVISRAAGQSVVASAAYRSAERLHDRRLDQSFDYEAKRGVAHVEILAPEGAPAWATDRQALWNAVEAVERRKDAQLAREIEIALPVELDLDQQIELTRAFAREAFLSHGMVVDLAIHTDNPENPHAHLLLTTREITPEGFGAKRRDWNGKAQLLEWRERWAALTNEHLRRAGHDIEIDHRSLEDQGIELLPGRKIGISRERQQSEQLPPDLEKKVRQQREIAAENGRRILADPSLALTALTHHQATFTQRDVAKYLHTRTDGPAKFQEALLKVTMSPEVVPLGKDDRGQMRYSTREMIAVERALLERAERQAQHRGHAVSRARQEQGLVQGLKLSGEQREAFEHVTGPGDLAVVVGVAGAGKSTMLERAREAWEAEGYTVKGAALSGIAAENLEISSGIGARTLASWAHSWSKGRDPLTSKDVLVIDEAGLVGTRQLAAVLEQAERAHAKVILIGDPEQLQAIEAGAAFRGIAAQIGAAQLAEVRRQREGWQKEATQALATGRTVEGLAAYEREQQIHALPDRVSAREALIKTWQRDGEHHSGAPRLILAYTRDDVQRLNEAVRALRQEAGELGPGQVITTARGEREFAAGDRLYFLKNERSLGVKNGSLGTLESQRDGVLQIRLDGDSGRTVAIDTRQYPHLDHGYAATVYKAQGVTVDRTYVLATHHFDRHSSYVALSRHRESASLFYGQEDFQPAWKPDVDPHEYFKSTLSRERAKDLARDYLERPESPDFRAPDREAARSPEPFAGLTLRSRDTSRVSEQGLEAARTRDEVQLQRTPGDRDQARWDQGLDRFGRAWSDAGRMREQGLPVLEHQTQEMNAAVRELAELRPREYRVLRSAITHDPQVIDALDHRQGTARVEALKAGIEQERQIHDNPARLARRTVLLWRQLEEEKATLSRWDEPERYAHVQSKLKEATFELKRDPQLESLLREHWRQLGIARDSQLGWAINAPSLEHALSMPTRGLGR
jgi:Ti-type conjugative transfer relaxase TraA